MTDIIWYSIRTEAYVENFKAGNVEHTDESSSFLSSGQSLVANCDQVFEETIKQTLGQSTDGIVALVDVHALRHKLVTDLNLGFGDVLVQIHGIYSH